MKSTALFCGLFAYTAMVFSTLSEVVDCHATTNPNSGPPGSYFQTSIRIPHGCNGSATTNVTIVLPEGSSSVKPRALAGWKIQINLKNPETKSVESLTWFDGNLSSEFYEDFGISLKLPTGEDNKKIYFPTYQKCVEGSVAWADIPQPGNDTEPEHPAPEFTLKKSLASDDHSSTGANTNATASGDSTNAKSSAALLSVPVLSTSSGLLFSSLLLALLSIML